MPSLDPFKISRLVANNRRQADGRPDSSRRGGIRPEFDRLRCKNWRRRMPAGSWRRVALAGTTGATVVLVYFSPWLLSPFLFKPSKHPVPNTLIFSVAAAGAVLAAAMARAFPRYRVAVVRILAVTAFVYLSWRLAIFWIDWLATLPLSSSEAYWLYRGPGSGALGLLPSAAIVLLGGRFLFGMSIRPA